MDLEKIGKIIKQIRIDNDLTQEQFASKYHVTYQAVSKWENGKSLPDISVLKQISNDYNVSFEDILEGEIIKKSTRKQVVFLLILSILLLLSLVFIVKHFINHDTYNFKTLSSTCDAFKVSGSIAYDKEKSSIYISNIDYCGGDDQTVYESISCTLYENTHNSAKKVSECKTSEESVKLEKYLSDIELNIDNYKQTCKTLDDDSLYLEIMAKKDNKTITYKVPLRLNNNCPK